MLFINIFLLFQLISCEETRNCDFNEPESVSNIVEQMAGPSKGLLNKIGINVDFTDMFGINLTEQGIDINQYIYDAGSFAIIFLAFFILLFVYFIVMGITACCCCCHAKNSKKPDIVHIFFHYLGILLLVLAAIMIFLSSSSVIKAVDKVRGFPSDLNTEIDGIADSLNLTISGTFDTVDKNVDNFISLLGNFTDWLDTSSKINEENSQNSQAIINKYNNVFTDSEYQSEYNTIKAGTSYDQDLNKEVEAMDKSRNPAIKAIENLSKQLIDSMQSISETSKNIKDASSTSIQTVKDNVNTFRNGEAVNQINNIKDTIGVSSLDLDTIEDLSSMLYPLLKIFFYIIASLILVVAILYAAFFFCHNCCSRCVYCSFPVWGLLLTLIIILPGCILSILFVVFNNLCPELENTLSSFIDSSGSDDVESYRTLFYNSIFPNKNAYKFSIVHTLDETESTDNLFKNLTEMLVCEQNTPILELLNLDFNIDDIIGDFKKSLGGSVNFEIPSDLKKKLDGFGENFDVNENITSNHILYNHKTVLPKVQKIQNLEESATKMMNIISGQESNLGKVRNLMSDVIEFGSSIVPETEKLNERTQNLVDQLVCDANDTINDGLDSITCMSFKCVYSPFKNMLCVDLLAGFAFWVISMILSIIGLVIISITACRRRRSMATSKIQNSESSETDTSIDEFEKDDEKDD